METSASFEARSAPSSYSTACTSPGSHMREVTFFVTTGNGEIFKGTDGVLARHNR